MAPFNLGTCARPNILALKPYRCARDDYKDDGTNILLDANENAYGPPIATTPESGDTPASPEVDLRGLHRYPDPHQAELKQLLCDLRNTHHHTAGTLSPENLFVGVGSDEAIDALLRCFCVPGRDRILVCPPTYGMYSVSAQVNDVSLIEVPLGPAPDFALNTSAILAGLSEAAFGVKVVYLCSPGNPTGSLLAKDDVRLLLEHPTWNGIVVLDEAYVDFAPDGTSLAEWVLEWPNLVVMQTLSKAFGMAGIRLGTAFAAAPVARLLNNLKAPYNVSSPTSALACRVLSPPGLAAMRANRDRIVRQRDRLLAELPRIPGVGRLMSGTASNFLLFEMLGVRGQPNNATALAVYKKLAESKGVVVRFRGREPGCLGCLRITVGTEEEVTKFLAALEHTLEEVRTGVRARISSWDEAEKEQAANEIVA